MGVMNEIERQTIASLMWNGAGNFLEATGGLSADCFTEPKCAWLFEVLQERALAGKPLNDLLMIERDLAQNGHAEMTAVEIITLTADVTPVLDVRPYVETLCDMRTRRRVKTVLTTVLQRADDVTVPVEKAVTEAVNALVSSGGLAVEDTIRLTDVLMQIEQRIRDNAAGCHDRGFLTGFSRLDEYGGLHAQDLVIVGGWSSHGKTALALTMVMNAARQSETRVLIFSMEMAAMQIGARMLAPEAKVPSSVILYRTFRERGMQQMQSAINSMADIADRIFIGDSSIQNIDGILGSIRLHHARYGTRLVVVDYLQIVGLQSRRDATREDGLADVARRLKNIAKELDICVILLSQINRDGVSSGNPEPTAAQLRGSGQINEAADLTLLVYRPEVHGAQYRAPYIDVPTHGTALLKIEKDRNGGYGGIGQFIVGFDGQTTSFMERGK